MRLSEEKQEQICAQFLEMMRRLDAHFASQVRLACLAACWLRALVHARSMLGAPPGKAWH